MDVLKGGNGMQNVENLIDDLACGSSCLANLS